MKKILLSVFLATIFVGMGHAQTPVRAREFNLEKGLALQGYDPVAYFLQNKAIKGNGRFTASADGVLYHFASAANKDLFVKDYQKFEPQYGGWCAYAMGATNERVEIDPEKFKIVNGKLYLFYHSWVNNTLSKWNKNEATLKASADKNWMTMFK